MAEVVKYTLEELCQAVQSLNQLHIKGIGQALSNKEIEIINNAPEIKEFGTGKYGKTYCLFFY